MRKAFDANVPKIRPRLRLGALASGAPAAVEEDAPAELDATPSTPPLAAAAAPSPALAPELHRSPEAIGAEAAAIAQRVAQIAHEVATEHPMRLEPSPAPRAYLPEPLEPRPARAVSASSAQLRERAPEPIPERAALDPKERRERLKERLKAATARVEPAPATPSSPTEARASALALVAQLQQELVDTRALNTALEKDLEQARQELGRAAQEAHDSTDEARRMAVEVQSRAALVDELGKELESLEAERDDALVGLRSARMEMDRQIGERQQLSAQLTSVQAELAETLTEEERLAAELEDRVGELKRSEAALQTLTSERDALARQVGELTRERAGLLDSRKALDEIHRALAEARGRARG